MRCFWILTACLLLPLNASSQDDSMAKKLTVTPAAEPRPALKYSFFPALREKTPGNAALAYMRAYAARNRNLTSDQAKQEDAATEKFEQTPIAQLDVAKLEAHLKPYHDVLQDLAVASRCERCDWDLLPRPGNDTSGIRFQDFLPARESIRFVLLKVKLEIAQNHTVEAAKWLSVAFQMAKHTGEAAFMIDMVLGLALENKALECVETWIANPTSPNLYWALTALPRPLIDPRIAFEGEDIFFEKTSTDTFPHGYRVNAKPLPAKQADEMLDMVFEKAKTWGTDTQLKFFLDAVDQKQLLAITQYVKKTDRASYLKQHLQPAKDALLARGFTMQALDQLPNAQILMLHGYERFAELRDDQRKCLTLPYHEAKVILDRFVAKHKEWQSQNKTDVVLTAYLLLLPGSDRVYFANARTERLLAALRVIEAIRLHAASTEGQLPAKLTDITLVPIPDDPVRGKPFEYSVTGNKFTLTAPAPTGETASRQNMLRYIITMKTK